MQYGYARVSTDDQETALQRDALSRAGIASVVEEKRSGVGDRPLLEGLLTELTIGDVLVVYKVDRLARSLADLLRILTVVRDRGAVFRSLTEPIETATPMGELLLHMLGAFAQFERSIMRERCAAGVRAAMERGIVFGRPVTVRRELAKALLSEGLSQSEVARRVGCHPSAVNRLANGRRRR